MPRDLLDPGSNDLDFPRPPRDLLADDIPAISRPASAGSSFMRGLIDTVAALPKAIDEGSIALANKFGDTPILGNPAKQVPEDMALYQLGDAMSKWAKEKFPTSAEYEEEFFAGKLPSGLGSTLGFAAGGLAGAAAKIPAAATVATLGAASQGVGQAEDYKKAMAEQKQPIDPQTRAEAFGLGLPLGTTEAVPIARLLERLDNVTGGGVKRILAQGVKGGLEEATQEIIQQIGQNYVANGILKYDPDRDLFNDVRENAEVGGGVGFLLNTLAATIGARRGNRTAPPADEGLGDAFRAAAPVPPQSPSPSTAAKPAPQSAPRDLLANLVPTEKTFPSDEDVYEQEPANVPREPRNIPSNIPTQTQRMDQPSPSGGAAVAEVYPPAVTAQQDGTLRDRRAELREEPDRRQDVATRKIVADMTPDEMRQALHTDELTGLRNRRAYNDNTPKKVQAALDVDSLKWINDSMGHGAGDTLLQTLGQALKEEQVDAFRFGGDEFVAQHDNEAELDSKLARVAERLKSAKLEYTAPDGTKIVKTGIGFSYGKGSNLQTADEQLAVAKSTREQQGLRAPRGGVPGGVVKTPAQGREAEGDVAATQAVAPEPRLITEAELVRKTQEQGDRRRIDAARKAISENREVSVQDARDAGIESTPAGYIERFGRYEPVKKAVAPTVKEYLPVLSSEQLAPLSEKQESSEGFTVDRLNQKTNEMEAASFKRGEYVRYTLSGKDAFGEIEGISNARREFSINGLWYPFGFAYKADKPPVKKKPTVPLSKAIEAFNKKHAPRFSKSAQPQAGLSVSEVEKTAKSTFGNAAKNIRIVQSVKDLPRHLQGQGNVSGITDSRTGEVYLVADHLLDTKVRGTVLHEFLHSAIHTDPEMDARRDALLKQFSELQYLAEKGSGSLAKWVKEASAAIPADTLEAHRSEELAAYALEQYEQTPTSLPAAFARWARGVIAAVKAWLVRHKLYESKTITPADLSQIAKSWMRRFESGSEVGEGVALASKQASTFYSAVLKAANDIKQERGTPEQMLAQIKKTPGVKQEELEWLGLEEWIKQQGPSVTKTQIADFVRANQVEVREVTLADRSDLTVAEIKKKISDGDRIDVYDGEKQVSYDDIDQYPDDATLSVEGDNNTKFKQYQIPGGENYRELLLTLPIDEKQIDGLTVDGVARALGYSGWHSSLTEDQKAHVNRVFDSQSNRPNSSKEQRPNTFKSSHFDEPNIFAHVRFNERTDADGKRVLFIEEVQSDWHQKGRKEGYAKPKSLEFKDVKGGVDAYLLGERMGRWDTREAAINDLRDHPNYKNSIAGIPDAPFKTTWPMLAMKRMIRYAAENNFDRIAWTTGEQQAERYDLNKQIDKVRVTMDRGQPDETGRPALLKSGRVAAIKDGNVVIDKPFSDTPGLADIVGKEVAEKAVAKIEAARGTARHGVATLEGLDLKIGDEGMKAFYDRMLPNEINKYVKKWGAKVAETTINPWSGTHPETGEQITDAGDRAHSIDITPAMRTAAMQGQPLFSKRKPDEPDTDLSGIEKFIEQHGDRFDKKRFLGKVKDLRPAMLGALSRGMLAELSSDVLPQMAAYERIAQAMDARRNHLLNEAGDVATPWAEWAGKNQADADRTAALMHDTTIAGVDPSEDYTALTTPEETKKKIRTIHQQMRGRSGENTAALMQKKAEAKAQLAFESKRAEAYPELKRRYDALPDEAKKIYRDVRDFYQARQEMVVEALMARIERADVSANEKAKLKTQIRQTFESNRVQGPYFPLARFGDFWASGKKGDEKVFYLFETSNEQSKYVAAMKANGFDVKFGKKLQSNQAMHAPPESFVADVIKILDKTGAPEDVKDTVYQLFLSTLPDLSMRKNFIHRKKTKGFSGDALRAFASQTFHGSYQLARLEHADQLQGLLSEMRSELDPKSEKFRQSDNPAKASDVLTEMEKRHEWIMNPESKPWANVANSIAFAWYMGLSPASALVNMLQTPMVALPVMGAQFGWGKSAAALKDASKQFMAHPVKFETGLSADETKAMAELADRGVFTKTQAHDLVNMSESPSAVYKDWRAKTMNIVSFGFHHAERFNRQVTSLAVYRLAREKGMSYARALDETSAVVNEAHFNYTNSNRPRFMQGDIAKVAFQFKQYSVNMTWILARNVYLSLKGESQQVKVAARRKLAGVLGMTALFAGANGLWLWFVVEFIMNAIYDDADEPWDFDTEMKNFLTDYLGEGAAQAITRGPVEAVTGVGISSRVSLNELWFRDPDKNLEGKAVVQYWAEQALGPSYGILGNIATAYQLIKEGHVQRGIETAVPKFLRDGMRSLRYADEGVQSMRGDEIISDTSAWQEAMQALGFVPGDLNWKYDANRALYNKRDKLANRRKLLIDKFMLARRLGDTEAQHEAKDNIRAWNKLQPQLKITQETLMRSGQARERRSKETQGGVYMPKNMRNLRDDVRYGQDE